MCILCVRRRIYVYFRVENFHINGINSVTGCVCKFILLSETVRTSDNFIFLLLLSLFKLHKYKRNKTKNHDVKLQFIKIKNELVPFV